MQNGVITADLEVILLSSAHEDDQILAGLTLLFGTSKISACLNNDLNNRLEELLALNAVWVVIPNNLAQMQEWQQIFHSGQIHNQRIVALLEKDQKDIWDFCQKHKLSCETIEHIDAAQLAHKILDAWQEFTNGILQEEVAIAQDFGALALLAERTGKKIDFIIERARLAYGLAASLSSDQNFIRRTIRLALFLDVQYIPAWSEVVRQTRHLWWINELLQHVYVGDKWRPNYSLENYLVLTAKIVQEESILNEAKFRQILRDRSSEMPFQMRTNLRLAAEKAFKQIWERSVRHVA